MKETGIIKSDTVANIMTQIDRKDFCPNYGAYLKWSQPIGHNAVISSPEIIRPTGKVLGIEHIPELAYKSIEMVKKNNGELLDSGCLVIKTGDGRDGYIHEAPYDVINVGAAASDVPYPKDQITQSHSWFSQPNITGATSSSVIQWCKI